jgi:invasion protein IalB
MREACVAGLRTFGWGLGLAALLGLMAAAPAAAQSGGSSATKKSASPPGKDAPQAKVVGSFGNWTLLCGKEDGDKQERCSLVLPLIEKESQKLVFRVILTYGPQGKLILRVDGPTGVALQRGIEFSPDTQKVYRMAFQTCLPMGCKALLIVEDDLRKELTASKQSSITVYALNGKAVRTIAELDGFAEGMKALDKHIKGQG